MKQLFHGKHFDLIHDGRDYVVNELIKSPHHFFDDFMRLAYDALIRPNDTVVEVGAHVGTHTVYLSRKAKRVYAFEPQPRLFLNLCANLWLNDCENVVPYQTACSNRRGWMKADRPAATYDLDQRKASISFSPSDREDDFLRVWACRLDDLHFDRLDFLKIDAEGHDLEVAQGGANTIERCCPFIVFEDNAGQLVQWAEWLQPMGYDIAKIGEGNYAALPRERALALEEPK
jgi:FkbM family methyltransferase